MKLKRVSQLTLGLFLPANCFTQRKQHLKNQQPPNIMIILADDLGFSDIGAYGGEIKTLILIAC
jgi:arylsulfatase